MAERDQQQKGNYHVGLIPGLESVFACVGDDPEREGLAGTPERWIRAVTEMCDGYGQDPAQILSTQFESEKYDQMIIVRDVEFTSLCEHHLLPFAGVATVGYIPGFRDEPGKEYGKWKVVGLSKLARLVMCFAHRLQIQERMTAEIAESLHTHVDTEGAGCLVKAVHSCMACRGVRVSADMITSHVVGSFRSDPMVRAEFLQLARPA